MKTSKKRGLSRGLSNLLSETTLDIAAVTHFAKKPSHLPVESLAPGKYQPRQEITPALLEELAKSIMEQGIIQPIIVRQTTQHCYEIIAGERRWRAAKLAGLKEVPVLVREIPDEAALVVALIENIQREDLNPLEEAFALKRLQEERQLTHQEVANAIGKSRVTVTNLLRLLDLHPQVKEALLQAKIDQGHAKVLLGLPLPDQAKALHLILERELSVRETEQLIQQWGQIPEKKLTKPIDPNVGSLERKLSDHLGTPVIIHHNKKGRGKLIIHYKNLDILDGVIARLKIKG